MSKLSNKKNCGSELITRKNTMQTNNCIFINWRIMILEKRTIKTSR